MPRRSSKKKKRSDLEQELREIPPDRAGLPSKESIQSIESFVSPQGQQYRILHTDEKDAYDPAPESSAPRKSRRSPGKSRRK